jgi:hypothetical protein
LLCRSHARQNRARFDAPAAAAPAPREPTVDPAELLARIGEQTYTEFETRPARE